MFSSDVFPKMFDSSFLSLYFSLYAEVESLWLLVRDTCMPRNSSLFLVGFLYHPPGACDLATTNHIITSIDDTINKHPHTSVMLFGNLNNLNDT